ncbi:MAG: L,D-transpeptidase family protein [Planctomycetes bacterium]|nr:L,D-transpeptidase family protein [Planctomycetota bacterium]
MLRRTLILVSILFASSLASLRADDLPALFAAAEKDPGRIPSLLIQASSELAKLESSDPKQAAELGDKLEPYCKRVFFSSEVIPGAEALGVTTHVVEKGELPSVIAKRMRTSAGLLAYLNAGYDEKKIRIGQKLRVLDLSDKSLHLEVKKSVYRLFLWRSIPGGDAPILLACMPVGLGAADSPTPEGSTSILKRVRDPEWTDPDSHQVIPASSPKNILGGYWIALDANTLGTTGIGLHGFTGDIPKNWIEQPASHGCVRMLQPDIDRVFHTALEGTPVAITK